MADNNRYIATWSDDITSIQSAGATYNRNSIGHGTLTSGLIDTIVAVWMTNTSPNTYLATAHLSNVGNLGQNVILPPYSTVVFKGASEKLVSDSSIVFSLIFPIPGSVQPSPSAGEVVANVTVEIADQQGN